jgi:hypothetical protein
VLLQFGVRSRNTVPVAVFAVSPGGVMQEDVFIRVPSALTSSCGFPCVPTRSTTWQSLMIRSTFRWARLICERAASSTSCCIAVLSTRI